MPRHRREPRWLTRAMLEAMHRAQIREHGGASGVRDESMLESALARPRNKHAYANDVDRATLAAAYAFGLGKNHPFADGNKRTAFIAAYVFLNLNGYDLDTEEPDVATTIDAVAAGRFTESALATWIRDHTRELKP